MLRSRPWTFHTPRAVPTADGERAVPAALSLADREGLAGSPPSGKTMHFRDLADRFEILAR